VEQDRRFARFRALLVESPRPLALLRIVVPLVILISPELYAAPALAASPERLGFVPEGLGLVAHLPLGPGPVRLLQMIAFSAAATAILGFWSRASMLLLTVSAGLLFSLSQRGGAVLHDMHSFWMTALLAASPCGDAWSLDAGGRAPPAPSLRYGVPLTFARVFLGLVYFFPGLHKVLVSGARWTTAENVVHHMRAKWLEHGALPFLRIDHAPALCAAGAVLVVVFELTFVVLALASPRTRWVALGAGLAFHLSTQVFFFIPFVSLWACYVVLLSPARWRPSSEATHAADAADTRPDASVKASAVVGLVIVVAIVVQGLRGQTQAWPFACYPTFAHVQTATIPDVLVEVVMRDETRKRLTGREQHARSQLEWGRVFRISGAYGDVPPAAALRDHARGVVVGAGIEPAEIARTKIYRVDVATAPESWGDAPLGGTLLLELTGAP
jgi:hypothetical protein